MAQKEYMLLGYIFPSITNTTACQK